MSVRMSRGSWIVMLCVAASAVAYVKLLYLPARAAIRQMREEIELKQEYLAQSAGAAAGLDAVQKELLRARQYNTAWEKHAPATKELPSLFGQINALAKAAGAVATRFDPDPIIESARVGRIPIVMNCTGRFSQVFEFLRDIEKLPEEIWIISTILEKTDATRKDINCEVSMVVFTDNPENSD